MNASTGLEWTLAMDVPRRRGTGDVVRAYLVLPHAVPILAVLAATGAFAVVAAGGWPGAADFVCLLGAMFGGQLAVGAVNELVDADLDRLSKPHKPIAAGLVSERGAVIVSLAGLTLMVLFSIRFSLLAFAFCALGNGAGIAYSVWFKRTMWSWIPYVIAIPLIPIWVWTALDAVPLRMLAIYPIAVPAMVSLQIAQSIPDVDPDRIADVRTLAVVLGEGCAKLVCWALTLISIAIAAALAPMVTDDRLPVWIAGSVSAVLVGVNVLLWQRDARTGRMSCFPCIAAAVVVTGVGWTAALVGG